MQTFSRATRALVAGDADLAEQLATEAHDIGIESGEPDAAGLFGPQLMGVAFERGTMGELVTIIEQSAIETPGSQFRGGTGARSGGRRDTDAARHLLEEFAATSSISSLRTASVGLLPTSFLQEYRLPRGE